MALHPQAGRPATPDLLIDVSRLLNLYHTARPSFDDPAQRVSFGTSGHRGTSLDATFTEAHILAITQAICLYRRKVGITGPLFIGMDSHALSAPAQQTALEVLAAHGVDAIIQAGGGFAPTPVISHAILNHNRGKTSGLADGIVITPSHNPPSDGGFKYNPPNGGPADTDATGWIQDQANLLLKENNVAVRRVSTVGHSAILPTDLVTPYVRQLDAVIDMQAIARSGLKLGVDPLGGASVAYWSAIADYWKLDLTITNPAVDPQFAFMHVDHDGKIRMDCSSPHAMGGLLRLKDRFALAFANDPDADRHGIVTPQGLMNPNHYLAVAISYLFRRRPSWSASAAIGKTLVSSAIIDRVAAELGRKLMEVPVGFKWFTPGLFDGSLGFGGEESAGASFLRRDGTPWSTDKDGLILGLLAAEITAVTGKNPAEHYAELTARHGAPLYTRIDRPASPKEKAILKKLSPAAVTADTLAGDAITARLTRAPGNGADIGGLKVATASGWFAARPSGTENIYKIYAESFKDQRHLDRLVDEAGQIVAAALRAQPQ